MVAERSNHTSKEQRLSGPRRAVKSYSMFKVRRGSCEEIPHPQGRGKQVRWKVLREASEDRDTNHNHRKQVNQITWATAWSNSMKLSHALWGHPRWAGHGGEV